MHCIRLNTLSKIQGYVLGPYKRTSMKNKLSVLKLVDKSKRGVKLVQKAYNLLRKKVENIIVNTYIKKIPDNAIHRYNTIYIDPNSIDSIVGQTQVTEKGSYHLEHTTTPSTGDENLGKVVPGNWDQDRSPISSLSEHQAIKQRYGKGKCWTETEFYRQHLSRIDEVGRSYGCQSRSDLLSKLKKLDKLYVDIKEEGYKRQIEISMTNCPLDEIRVNIGRDGKILFNEQGRHRLAIAQVLNVERVPVLISWIHSKFLSQEVGIRFNE